jgi:hypothetical protein
LSRNAIQYISPPVTGPGYDESHDIDGNPLPTRQGGTVQPVGGDTSRQPTLYTPQKRSLERLLEIDFSPSQAVPTVRDSLFPFSVSVPFIVHKVT